MPSDMTARRLYDQAIVIDGLNVSSWDSPAVFRSLHAGGVTAINATIVTWRTTPRRWTPSPLGSGALVSMTTFSPR